MITQIFGKSIEEMNSNPAIFENINRLKVTPKLLGKIVSKLEARINEEEVQNFFKERSLDARNFYDFLRYNLQKSQDAIKYLKQQTSFVNFLKKQVQDNKVVDKLSHVLKEFQKKKYVDELSLNQSELLKKLIHSDTLKCFHNVMNNGFYRFHLRELSGEFSQITDIPVKISQIKDYCNKAYNSDSLKSMKFEVFNVLIDHIFESSNTSQENAVIPTPSLILNKFLHDFKEFSPDGFNNEDTEFFSNAIFCAIEYDNIIQLYTFFFAYFEYNDQYHKYLENICFKDAIDRNAKAIQEILNIYPIDKLRADSESFNNYIQDVYQNKDICFLSKHFPIPSSLGITMEESPAFFCFWTTVAKFTLPIISEQNDDEENINSQLVLRISEFVQDKNSYDSFHQHLSVIFSSPTQQNLLFIFDSIMMMFNSIDFENNKSFENVSKRAITYFLNHPDEIVNITNKIEILMKQEKEILPFFEKNYQADEYKYVEKIRDGEYKWRISFNDHICLVDMKTNSVVVNYAMLQLVNAKINITIIRKEKEESTTTYDNSRLFVKQFQKSEKLYECINNLHKLYIEEGNSVFEFIGFSQVDEDNDIDQKINNLEETLHQINSVSPDLYDNEIGIFTKEHIFYLFNLLKNNNKPNIYSILKSNIISSNRELKKDFDYQVHSNEGIPKYLCELRKFIIQYLRSPKSAVIEVESKKHIGITQYVEGSTVRGVSLNHSAGIHSMAFFLLTMNDQNIPQPAQLLICSMTVTESQIDSFFTYFKAAGTGKLDINKRKVFVIVSPIHLPPVLYDKVMTELEHINQSSYNNAHIVILFESKDMITKKGFADHFYTIRNASFEQINTLDTWYKNLFSLKNKLYGIRSYFIYSKYPRTGKTHLILNHIHSEFANHVYARVLIDESTTETQLISMLNSIEVPKDKTKYICIHFNVDGHVKMSFTYYIQNLALFRSLNDGFSLPFRSRTRMVFYFEFGSRPALNTQDFIKEVFPLGNYIEEIKIPSDTKSFFTYDEYQTSKITIKNKHDQMVESLHVDIKKNNRTYIPEAAALIHMSHSPDSFLRTENKSALNIRYSDYISYYNTILNEYKANPARSYEIFTNIYKNQEIFPVGRDHQLIKDDFSAPLISQIGDVARIISTFKGSVLSQNLLENEKGIGRNIRLFMLGLLVESGFANCGLPYEPPTDDQNNISESAMNDTKRLKRFSDFLKEKGYILTTCNPAGSPEEQSYKLIVTKESNDDENEIVKKLFDRYKIKYEDAKIRRICNSLGVITNKEWKAKEKSQDELFEELGYILNLPEIKKDLYSIVVIILTWRCLNHDFENKARIFWKDNIKYLVENVEKKQTKAHVKINEEIAKYLNGQPKEECFRTNEQLKKYNKFLHGVQDILKHKPFFNDKKNKFDQIVPNDISEFITILEKYLQQHDSLMIKYTLTLQNINRFIHLIYRIYSNVPIILMGETGSGKTFTMKFLAEIIGKNTELFTTVIDGGTTEEAIRSLLHSKLNELEKQRQSVLKEKLQKVVSNSATQNVVKEFFIYLKTVNNWDLSSNDSIETFIDQFINEEKAQRKLINYDVHTEQEIQGFKGYIQYNVQKILQKIDSEQKNYLFFFDEVNTAPCQWFLKEVIVDRYFEGRNLPSYIHFACAVNPYREIPSTLKKQLDALDPKFDDDSQDKRKNLIYKVGEMPESFIPFLFPADPSREYQSYISDGKITEEGSTDYRGYDRGNLYQLSPNSEFDLSTIKVVEENMTKIVRTYEASNFDSQTIDSEKIVPKIGDKYHFSTTSKFCTSFNIQLFNEIYPNDPTQARCVQKDIINAISLINVFSCRTLYHEIYQDESFSSIRDPERCINIMRWAYNFGLFEPIPKNKTPEIVLKRIRRAFIIGLSTTFYLRLSSQTTKDSPTGDRIRFLEFVCNFWRRIIEKDNIEIGNAKKQKLAEVPEFQKAEVQRLCNKPPLELIFPAPTPKEWIAILEEESKSYADLFVEEDECVSKNIALNENIWASFICIMNNIPLWIIGKPGTSKSLAVNIVINKLMNHRSTNYKITISPPIVSQTFMCSNLSTSEAIKEQLGRIVRKGRMYPDNYVINIQILEEIGHADMSRFRPLVCLHNIIDNGYELTPNVRVPVTLIGLSNYKMDSAKLNRGILLLRGSLDKDALEQTSYEIFQSTALAQSQYNKNNQTDINKIKNAGKKFSDVIRSIGSCYQDQVAFMDNFSSAFVGLRDFYGLVQSITKPFISGDRNNKDLILSLIRRNFSGINNEKKTHGFISALFQKMFPDSPDLPLTDEFGNKCSIMNVIIDLIEQNISEEQRDLKTPIVRHILISTHNNAAFPLVFQDEDFKRKVNFFFDDNLTDVTDPEWVSNELRRLTKVMKNGETAAFIGNHPCFSGLYDVFNLRYQNEGVDQDNEQISRAMISYGGDSYPVIVKKSFRAIIIVENDVYESFPQPFLNRFEKYNLTFENELSRDDIEYAEKIQKIYEKIFYSNKLDNLFGCFSEELFKSCINIANYLESKDDFSSFTTLSIHPASLFYSYNNNIDDYIESTLFENSNFHSTLLHFLLGYSNKYDEDTSVLCEKFYKSWQNSRGIKAILMLPSLHNIDLIKHDFYLIRIDASNPFNLDKRFQNEIDKLVIAETSKKTKKKQLVISLYTADNPGSIAPHLLHFESILENLHKKHIKSFNAIHTLILINMSERIDSLQINQSFNWPLIYLDSCMNDIIKTKKDGRPLSLQELIFTPLTTLFPQLIANEDGENDIDDVNSIIDFDTLVNDAITSIIPCFTSNEAEMIKKLSNNDTNHEINSIIKHSVLFVIQRIPDPTSWTKTQISALPTPPPSLLEYLSQKLILIIGNIISLIFRIYLSGFSSINENLLEVNKDLCNELLNRPEILNVFNWMFSQNTPQISPIENRYDAEYPGQLPLYTIIWELAFESFEDQPDDIKNYILQQFQNYEENILEKVKELFDSEVKCSSQIDTFLAAYLLRITSSVRVKENYKDKFSRWVKNFKSILVQIINKKKKDKISVEFLISLLKNPEFCQLASKFTTAFMFIPDKVTLDECLIKSVNDRIESPVILTLTACLLRDICENLIDTLSGQHLTIREVYEMFITEFTIIVSLRNIMVYIGQNGEEEEEEAEEEEEDKIKDNRKFLDGYIYENEFYNYFLTLQQFFLTYGENIVIDSNTIVDFEFVKPEEWTDVNDLINTFAKQIDKIKTYIKDCEIEDIIATAMLQLLELSYEPYIGLIDEEGMTNGDEDQDDS
ncbi:hypothetical protein TRFO_35297 [Tritrichomonas foetus]|uniref:AAA+ ATPase domain-containing protein n=1 Tax=Tritrichomonas foetus TaxID=1144522 RepID=A0A1J4JGM2_9EUKA|nr:hypothetical protein TRFO_35297 [Tritrichomonas foetus]|eukprot:OHS98298.1 hypothetical protein TRFO_35297 [Tritrichomonas foetus]